MGDWYDIRYYHLTAQGACPFDGKEVTISADLSRLVSDAAPEAKGLEFWRDRTAKEIVNLGEAGLGAAINGADRFGLILRELGRSERQSRQSDGVVVVEVVERLASESELQAGDVILSINNRPNPATIYHVSISAGRHARRNQSSDAVGNESPGS